jgi:hypothetical protein
VCISWNNKKCFDTVDARCKHEDVSVYFVNVPGGVQVDFHSFVSSYYIELSEQLDALADIHRTNNPQYYWSYRRMCGPKILSGLIERQKTPLTKMSLSQKYNNMCINVIYCCVFDWTTFYLVLQHNGMATIKFL